MAGPYPLELPEVLWNGLSRAALMRNFILRRLIHVSWPASADQSQSIPSSESNRRWRKTQRHKCYLIRIAAASVIHPSPPHQEKPARSGEAALNEESIVHRLNFKKGYGNEVAPSVYRRKQECCRQHGIRACVKKGPR